MEDTWTARDLAVLTAIVELDDESVFHPYTQVRDIAVRAGLSADEVFKSCRHMDGTFIEMNYVMAGGNPGPHRVQEIYAQARVAVGQWPSPEALVDRLLAALEELAEHGGSEDTRGRARRAVEALAGVTRDVLVNAAGSALGSVGGLG